MLNTASNGHATDDKLPTRRQSNLRRQHMDLALTFVLG
jgi:hypothetical protein